MACGTAGHVVTMPLSSTANAIARLDELRAVGVDRLCLPTGSNCAAIAAWAAAAALPINLIDVDAAAQFFCGSEDAATVVAEAERRAFYVTDAEAQAIAAFDFVLGGHVVTRAGEFQ
ncbi:hypothetical protein [Arvimicrobium flavum]|uniref:hypothetical protein n=1 Tax=Arvimicrobium flavum TaxID=3393320 RepID=UPI00237A1BE5|nr:hypothetical protein [Mesorhizobium shangrilense]